MKKKHLHRIISELTHDKEDLCQEIELLRAEVAKAQLPPPPPLIGEPSRCNRPADESSVPGVFKCPKCGGKYWIAFESVLFVKCVSEQGECAKTPWVGERTRCGLPPVDPTNQVELISRQRDTLVVRNADLDRLLKGTRDNLAKVERERDRLQEAVNRHIPMENKLAVAVNERDDANKTINLLRGQITNMRRSYQRLKNRQIPKRTVPVVKVSPLPVPKKVFKTPKRK